MIPPLIDQYNMAVEVFAAINQRIDRGELSADIRRDRNSVMRDMLSLTDRIDQLELQADEAKEMMEEAIAAQRWEPEEDPYDPDLVLLPHPDDDLPPEDD